jgi:hypothetical protein
MAKRLPLSRLTPVHLRNLDDDQLGMLAQRIEIETQQLNRAMRLLSEILIARRS